MTCEECIRLVSGTCEIYGDNLPRDPSTCIDKQYIEERNMGFHYEDTTAKPELCGVTKDEDYHLRLLERSKIAKHEG